MARDLMMPYNEGLYGNWPRCGEIDIWKFLEPTPYSLCHHTLWQPHAQQQGFKTLADGNTLQMTSMSFPWNGSREMRFYVDGELIHT